MTADEARDHGFVVDKEWTNDEGEQTHRPYLIAGVFKSVAVVVEGRGPNPAKVVWHEGNRRMQPRNASFCKPTEHLQLLMVKPHDVDRGIPSKPGLGKNTYFWFRPQFNPTDVEYRMVELDLARVDPLAERGVVTRDHLPAIRKALMKFKKYRRALDYQPRNEAYADG